MDISILEERDKIFKVPFLDGRIHIVYFPADEVQDIIDAATERSWDKKHRPIEKFDPIKYRKLLGRKVVRGWDDFTMKGEPYLYTPENCDFLMEKWADFANCVDRTCIDIQALMEAERKEKEKK